MSSIIEHSDPINAQILAISEDQIKGFVREPFVEIASAQDWLDRKAAPESMFSEADQAMFRAAGITPPRKG